MMFRIYPLMQNPAFRRKEIFFPDLFQVDQGILPLAEQSVLQSGNGDQILFIEHQPGPRID
jgi:hypothetical protein